MKSDINLTALAEFVNAAEQTEKVKFKMMRDLLLRIKPMVLDALYDVFELPADDVTWVDVLYMDEIIVLTCRVTYFLDKASNFLRNTFEELDEEEVEDEDEDEEYNETGQVTRQLILGIPITYAFTSKQAVIDFLQYSSSSMTETELFESSDVCVFDTELLSVDQRTKLELFKSCARGVKH